MNKEGLWLKKRCGYISASNVGELCSASGKVTEGNLDYIREKRWERRHGFSLPFTAHPMTIGKEQEPYAIAWFRENYSEMPIIYSGELDDIPFWTVPWAKFGASPDAFTEDESTVVEIKTVVSNKQKCFYGDEYTPYEDKKAYAKSEHLPQLLGQFLSKDKVREIKLVKYIYQDDNIMEDTDSVLAPWRGLVFPFYRKDYVNELAELKLRIQMFDAMIDAPISPEEFKSGWAFSLEKGLYQIKKEDKNGKSNK